MYFWIWIQQIVPQAEAHIRYRRVAVDEAVQVCSGEFLLIEVFLS